MHTSLVQVYQRSMQVMQARMGGVAQHVAALQQPQLEDEFPAIDLGLPELDAGPPASRFPVPAAMLPVGLQSATRRPRQAMQPYGGLALPPMQPLQERRAMAGQDALRQQLAATGGYSAGAAQWQQGSWPAPPPPQQQQVQQNVDEFGVSLDPSISGGRGGPLG